MLGNPSESQVSHLILVIITKESPTITWIAVSLRFSRGQSLVPTYCRKVTSFRGH